MFARGETRQILSILRVILCSHVKIPKTVIINKRDQTGKKFVKNGVTTFNQNTQHAIGKRSY